MGHENVWWKTVEMPEYPALEGTARVDAGWWWAPGSHWPAGRAPAGEGKASG